MFFSLPFYILFFIVSLLFIFSFLPANPQLKQSTSETDVDSLGVEVVVERRLTEFTADTGLLVTTERQLVVKHVVAVDPDGTGAERAGDFEGSVEVLGLFLQNISA